MLASAEPPTGTSGLAYFTFLSTVTFDMTQMAGTIARELVRSVERDHHRRAGEPVRCIGSRSFTPPGANGDGSSDWVLLLQAN